MRLCLSARLIWARRTASMLQRRESLIAYLGGVGPGMSGTQSRIHDAHVQLPWLIPLFQIQYGRTLPPFLRDACMGFKQLTLNAVAMNCISASEKIHRAVSVQQCSEHWELLGSAIYTPIISVRVKQKDMFDRHCNATDLKKHCKSQPRLHLRVDKSSVASHPYLPLTAFLTLGHFSPQGRMQQGCRSESRVTADKEP